MTTTPSLPITPSFVGLLDCIAGHGRHRPQDPAYILGGSVTTWSDWVARVDARAGTLHRSGVSRGDRVALLSGSSLFAYEAMWATVRAGAVITPLSTMLTTDTLADLVRDSGAKILIAGEGCEDSADAIAVASGDRGVTVLREQTWELDTAGYAAEIPRVTGDDLLNIIYSSGTTGIPKGIPHTHAARFWMAPMLAAALGVTQTSRALFCTPPYSNGTFLTMLPTLYCGGSCVVLPKFTADAFFDAVNQWRPTHAFLVPTQFQALLDSARATAANFAGFTALLTAGAPMPLEMKRYLQELAPGRLYEMWGLTEGVLTCIAPDDMKRRPEAVGRPLPGVELHLLGADDQLLGVGEAGEIIGRSNFQMPGYWNHPEIRAETYWRAPDGTEYLRTGDIGQWDADGFLHLRGRKKDMIISGGFNVYPIDIEAVLLRHPSVHDAAVVGVADPKWGEVPIAIVIPRDSGRSETQILEWANERLAKHQRLAGLTLRAGDFPRNALGKVLKNVLRQELMAAASLPDARVS